ncbi:MAG: transposase [Bacteroidales bacterium]|nr:transposase [Bacteroidales bacterium]
MRTGRPAKADTIYKIGIHTNGGHRYASTQPFTIDKDGKKHYTHKHWGTVDENLRFHPGTAYFYASIEERRKLIFPKEWDLSELETLSGTGRRGRIAYEADDVDRQYGPTWFLGQAAERTGLLDDLRSVFGGNMEMVNDILTLAYFPFIDNISYSHLAQWQREVKAPSERQLTSTAITRLTQSITEKHRMDLFRLRAKRLEKGELCAVDSTSMSTYGFNIADIRWGKNKEHLPLRQTVEIVVYSLTSHMPIYYRELAGNMPDSRTMELILTELEHAGFKDLVLITDRGYESMKNLELYISKGQKVISAVKVSQGDVLKLIREIDLSSGVPEGMEYSPEEQLYYRQFDGEYSVGGNGSNVIKADRLKINLFYSPKLKADAINSIQTRIDEQKRPLSAIVSNAEPVADQDAIRRANNMFVIEFGDNGEVKSFSVNQQKRNDALLTAGFFASKSIGMDISAMAANGTYGMRDEQEKTFSLQKGPLGFDRLRTWSESSRHGRMFVYFAALIIASYVRSVWESVPELRKRFGSTESLLAEMRTIRCIEHTGRMKFITPFIGAQVDICKAFGFTIPDGCAPIYVSKAKSATKKRGRPAKPKVEKQTY